MPAQAREPRTEGERLDPLPQPLREAIDEMEQQPRISLHRAADIADNDERPRLRPRLAVGPFEYLAAMTETPSERAVEIEAVTSAPPHSARESLPESPDELIHHSPHFVDFAFGEAREVSLPKDLASAPGLGDLDYRSLLGILGEGRRLPRRIKGRRSHERFRSSSANPPPLNLEELPFTEGRLPEHLEGRVEERDIVALMDQKGARGVIEIGLHAYLQVLERQDEIDHPSRVDVEAESPEHAAEENEIPKKVPFYPSRGGHRIKPRRRRAPGSLSRARPVPCRRRRDTSRERRAYLRPRFHSETLCRAP